MTITFNATKEDLDRANTAVDRYMKRIDALGSEKTGYLMDVIACHSNGCPLDLAALAEADDFDLVHDIGGIHTNIDRTTGKLLNCFSPRYTMKAS